MADRKTDTAPETFNSEQDDEDTQAQTVAEEAMDRNTSVFGLDDSDKVPSDDETEDAQDLVDHMNQMERSGMIDMSAFRGERNDDDEEGLYGDDADGD